MAREEKNFPIQTTGGRIQNLRKEKGYDRVTFHTLIYPNDPLSNDSRQKTVHNWESGKTSPDYETLRKMCSLLDCDSDYLLCMQETPRKETTDIQCATGLSTAAIKNVCEWKRAYPAIVQILSHLIVSLSFYDLLDQLYTAIEYLAPHDPDKLQQEYDCIKSRVGSDDLPYPDLKNVSNIDHALEWLSEYASKYVIRDRKAASAEAIHEAQNLFIRSVDEIMQISNITDLLTLRVHEEPTENEAQALLKKIQEWENK